MGEGEGVWPEVVNDASNGGLKPRYDAGFDLAVATSKPRVYALRIIGFF